MRNETNTLLVILVFSLWIIICFELNKHKQTCTVSIKSCIHRHVAYHSYIKLKSYFYKRFGNKKFMFVYRAFSILNFANLDNRKVQLYAFIPQMVMTFYNMQLTSPWQLTTTLRTTSQVKMSVCDNIRWNSMNLP